MDTMTARPIRDPASAICDGCGRLLVGLIPTWRGRRLLCAICQLLTTHDA